MAADPVNMPMSPENPSVDINDPDVWDQWGGGEHNTSAGIKVSAEKALSHPAVWQAVSMISDDVAVMPLELFREQSDGDKIKQKEHSTHGLVHWKPNDEVNAFKFWSRMLAWKLLWGNAYAYILRHGDGQPAEMLPLLPDRTGMERINGRLYCVTEVGGNVVPIPVSEVLHLEGVSYNGMSGKTFIDSARNAIGLALAEIDFASKFYKNGGRMGGILELPAGMPKLSRDRVEEGFKKHYGSNEAFKTVVLRENAKFHAAQMSPKEAQGVEARQESVRDIARLFKLRPGKLGEESRTSFASKSEDNRDYYDTTLRPHLFEIAQECRDKLLTDEQKRNGYYFQHDTTALLRMDFKSMSEALSTLRASEIINADEARGMINMNKREDGSGSDYRNPNINTTEAPSDAGSDAVARKAFQRMLATTLGRMSGVIADRAKRQAKDAGKFLAWIDEKFGEQQQAVKQAVGEVMAAAELAIDEPPTQEHIDSVVGKLIEEARQQLQTVAASTTADELQKVVAATMTEWIANCGERFACQILEDSQ